MTDLNTSPLGKKSLYVSQYQADLLFPIPRNIKRHEIDVPDILPFYGADIWHGFEISWLNPKGKPQVALSEFEFPCESSHIIESKSFKLYLNSFNNSRFEQLVEVEKIMQTDLSAAVGCEVKVKLTLLNESAGLEIVAGFNGESLDALDVSCEVYEVKPDFLQVENVVVDEILCSDLLKSNCLVTGQPDWGSVQIHYIGNKINRENLLKYLISFRNHHEFHEQCVERIFMNIMQYCAPHSLTVVACYTRRGGLDINPWRTTNPAFRPRNKRLCRQ